MNKVIILFVSLLPMLLSIDTLAMTCPGNSAFTKGISYRWFHIKQWHWVGNFTQYNIGGTFNIDSGSYTTQDTAFLPSTSLDVWIPLKKNYPLVICDYSFDVGTLHVHYHSSESKRVDYRLLGSHWEKAALPSTEDVAGDAYHCHTQAVTPELCSFSMH